MDDLVDRMKTSKDEVPLILVGGGSILIPENSKIRRFWKNSIKRSWKLLIIMEEKNGF